MRRRPGFGAGLDVTSITAPVGRCAAPGGARGGECGAELRPFAGVAMRSSPAQTKALVLQG
jgi:hypothetical protein